MKQDTAKIDAEIEKEQAFSKYFQGLVDALAKNTFSAPLDMGVIIDLAYNGNIRFLTTEAIAKTPVLAHLTINHESKESMVDLPATYPNYKEIMAAYNEVRSKAPTIRAKVYNFDLGADMQLTLSNVVKAAIRDSHTVYAKDRATFEDFTRLTEILNELKEFKERTNVNFLHPGIVTRERNFRDVQINVETFNYMYSNPEFKQA